MSERAGVKPSDMSAFWMPFHMNRQFKSAPRLLASVKGCATRRTTGGTFSRHSRTVALERAAYAGRSEAHLLCELGFGGGGYHAEDCVALLPVAWRRAAHLVFRTRAWISWHGLRRGFGGWYCAEQQGIFRWTVACYRSFAAYAEYQGGSVFERVARVVHTSRGRTRGAGYAARRADDCRSEHGVGGRIDRCTGFGARLVAAVAGDLQHARRPAGVREEPFNANPVGMLDSLISFACAPSRRT